MKNTLFYSLLAISVASTACTKEEDTTSSDPTINTTDFVLASEAVVNGELLDAYKCEDKVNSIENSIPLTWSNVPEDAVSLAIIMHHFPNQSDTTEVNSYLLLWGIDPAVTEIPYGMGNDGPWFMGANKDGTAISYTSPCSPSSGTHSYTISLYALDALPSSLPTESSVDVDYETLKSAIATVSVVGKAVLNFDDVTP